MPTREFWNEEPELLWAYRKSFLDKLRIKKDLINYEAWLNGLYVFDAVSVGIYNNFKKSTQPVLKYVEQPYDFNAKPKTKEEIAREERLKVEEQIRERNRQIKEMLKKNKK